MLSIKLLTAGFLVVLILLSLLIVGLPGGSGGKESTCNAGDQGLIPGLGRSPGEGNGNPPQYSCLENSMDRGTWRATAHVVTVSRLQLSDCHSLSIKLCTCAPNACPKMSTEALYLKTPN